MIHWFSPTLNCWFIADDNERPIMNGVEMESFDTEDELLDYYPNSRKVELR